MSLWGVQGTAPLYIEGLRGEEEGGEYATQRHIFNFVEMKVLIFNFKLMFKYVSSLALGSYAPESYIGVEPTRK